MKKKNFVLLFGSFLLCAIIVFVSVVSKGFTNMDPKTWFDKGTTQEKPVEPVTPGKDVIAVDGNGNKLTSEGSYAMPRQMTFLSASSETTEDEGILITAKLTPENVDPDLIKLNWYATWKKEGLTEDQEAWSKENTTWALSEYNGQNYIQLTVIDNTTCRVKCLKAFGCPLILSCKSMVTNSSETSVEATCQLDYAKRVTNFSPKFQDENRNVLSYSNDTLYFDFNERARLDLYSSESQAENDIETATWYTYGVGTVSDNYSMEYTCTLEEELYYGLNNESFNTNGTARQAKTFKGQVSIDLGINFIKDIFGFNPSADQTLKEFMYYVRNKSEIDSSTGSHIFDLTITLKGNYSTYEKRISVEFESWDYGTTVQSIELSQPNITF